MATIEIRIRTLAQLFNSLDPSPFHERALDANASSYILECAGEFPPNTELRLLLYAPVDVGSHLNAATQAIHTHYSFEHAQAVRRHRRRMDAGRVALLVGSIVMILCLAARAFLGAWIATPIGQVVSEGLLILSWVGLWRPAELLLFESWENHKGRRVLDRLSRIPVEFAVLAVDGKRSDPVGPAPNHPT